MARTKGEALAKELQKSKYRDYDPEDENEVDDSGSDESGSEAEQPLTGREHYEKVEKSRLRKPDAPVLGAQYGAVAVSRNALQDDEDSDPLAADDDEDDDPFATADEDSNQSDLSDQIEQPIGDVQSGSDMDAAAIDDDEEIDSDEALGESDIEKFKTFTFRGSKKNAIPTGEQDLTDSDGSSASDANDEEDDMSIPSDQDDEEESEEEEDGSEQSDEDRDVRANHTVADPTGRRGELKAELQAQNKAFASTLAQAASDDIAKGRAVKQQYQSLDRLLDSRIKLQKAVTASDQLRSVNDFGAEADEALKKAEEAATSILATIASLRSTVLDAQQSTPKKRKRQQPITSNTPTSTIWISLQSLEVECAATRKTTLDKWSTRTRAAGAPATSTSKSQLLGSETQQDKLTAILDTYILNEQSKMMPPTDSDDAPPPPSYSDTTFYQSLLRDLIQSRSSNSLSSSSQPTDLIPIKLHPSGNTSSAKKIDTRASKGRKIRYTVHDKLQNFMAAEGDPWASGGASGTQREWTEEGRREFFASLMGGARVLDENDWSDGDDTRVDKADEVLMLFRR